jgi:uncharacterized RDD family membrane protein YckC
MVYDAVLILGVLFAVGYLVLASQQWSYPLSFAQRAALQSSLFAAVGIYFVFCWTRTGQTLALKAWRLKVVDTRGRPPSRLRAVARYLLSWHLWLPGLAIGALLPTSAVWTLLALMCGFALLLTLALIDPQRRLLHDRWTGTRIVRVPPHRRDQGVAVSR